jgi:hypothetical protein
VAGWMVKESADGWLSIAGWMVKERGGWLSSGMDG